MEGLLSTGPTLSSFLSLHLTNQGCSQKPQEQPAGIITTTKKVGGSLSGVKLFTGANSTVEAMLL